MGLEAKTFFSFSVSVFDLLLKAKYLIAYLAETVFPAPDSPETMILWLLFSLKKKDLLNHISAPKYFIYCLTSPFY